MELDSSKNMDAFVRFILRFNKERNQQRLKDLEYQQLLELEPLLKKLCEKS